MVEDAFIEAGRCTPRAVALLVLGVSTRKYVRSIEPAPDGFVARGTTRSAVSRRFVAATKESLAELMGRDVRCLVAFVRIERHRLRDRGRDLTSLPRYGRLSVTVDGTHVPPRSTAKVLLRPHPEPPI